MRRSPRLKPNAAGCSAPSRRNWTSLQALDTELERLATEWTAQRGLAVVSALSGVCDVSPAGELRVVKYVTLADELGQPLSLAALAALAPALVRDGLRAVIARTPFDEGAPMVQRAALLADADRKIAALVTEHAELVDNALTVGITLEHLPITVGRRTQACAGTGAVGGRSSRECRLLHTDPERSSARAGERAVSGEGPVRPAEPHREPLSPRPPTPGDVLCAAAAYNFPPLEGEGLSISPGEDAWRAALTPDTAGLVWQMLHDGGLYRGRRGGCGGRRMTTAAVARELLEALGRDLGLSPHWRALASQATAAVERRILLARITRQLLVATPAARARLRVWLDPAARDAGTALSPRAPPPVGP